jgi:hypothetical protein
MTISPLATGCPNKSMVVRGCHFGHTQRVSECLDGGPPRGERGGHFGYTQRLSECLDGGPPRGERGGHFEAPA